MDPEYVAGLILTLIAEGDAEAARESCDDFREWIRKGGHRPFDWTPAQCAAFVTMAYATCDGLQSK